MTRVDTVAEKELEPFMLPSNVTVAAGDSDATQKTNVHADSCIRDSSALNQKFVVLNCSESLQVRLTKCFFLFSFYLGSLQPHFPS